MQLRFIVQVQLPFYWWCRMFKPTNQFLLFWPKYAGQFYWFTWHTCTHVMTLECHLYSILLDCSDLTYFDLWPCDFSRAEPYFLLSFLLLLLLILFLLLTLIYTLLCVFVRLYFFVFDEDLMLQVLQTAQIHTQNLQRSHGATVSFTCRIINPIHKEIADFSKKRIVAASADMFMGSTRCSSHTSAVVSPQNCL